MKCQAISQDNNRCRNSGVHVVRVITTQGIPKSGEACFCAQHKKSLEIKNVIKVCEKKEGSFFGFFPRTVRVAGLADHGRTDLPVSEW